MLNKIILFQLTYFRMLWVYSINMVVYSPICIPGAMTWQWHRQMHWLSQNVNTTFVYIHVVLYHKEPEVVYNVQILWEVFWNYNNLFNYSVTSKEDKTLWIRICISKPIQKLLTPKLKNINDIFWKTNFLVFEEKIECNMKFGIPCKNTWSACQNGEKGYRKVQNPAELGFFFLLFPLFLLSWARHNGAKSL